MDLENQVKEVELGKHPLLAQLQKEADIRRDTELKRTMQEKDFQISAVEKYFEATKEQASDLYMVRLFK